MPFADQLYKYKDGSGWQQINLDWGGFKGCKTVTSVSATADGTVVGSTLRGTLFELENSKATTEDKKAETSAAVPANPLQMTASQAYHKLISVSKKVENVPAPSQYSYFWTYLLWFPPFGILG